MILFVRQKQKSLLSICWISVIILVCDQNCPSVSPTLHIWLNLKQLKWPAWRLVSASHTILCYRNMASRIPYEQAKCFVRVIRDLPCSMTHCLSCSVSDGPGCIHMFGVITALSQLLKSVCLRLVARVNTEKEGWKGRRREGGMVVTCGSCGLQWGFEGQGAGLGLALLVLCHHKHVILSVPFQTGQHYVLANVGQADLRLPVRVFPLCTKKQPWNGHKSCKNKKRRKILNIHIYSYLDTHSFVSDQIMGDWWPSIILFDPFYFERIAFGM